MFSFSDIKNFDNHISKSIKGYEELNENIIGISNYFIEDNTNVYDIGCSTGKLISKYKNKKAKYFGIEIEKNLITQKDVNFNLINYDVRDFTGYSNASFVTSIFTMQFIPQKDRQKIINNIFNGLNKGGAFVICEKIYSKSPKIQDIMTSLYYDFKRKSFSQAEILDKEQDLRKIMKIETENTIFKELKKAGFSQADMFFRSFNFVGILSIKD
jgi:tRNA (cmo5U34)-methyltransferase